MDGAPIPLQAANADFLSPAEFARLAGISLATVWRYLADGRIPRLQPGGRRCRVLIPRSALVDPAGWQNSLPDSSEPSVTTTIPATQDDKPRGPGPRWLKHNNKG